MADVGPSSDEAVVTFDGIAILTPRYEEAADYLFRMCLFYFNLIFPLKLCCARKKCIFQSLAHSYWKLKHNLCFRGRYSVELHLSFFRLQGQANDFKIQYSSVVRLFLLPKVLLLLYSGT